MVPTPGSEAEALKEGKILSSKANVEKVKEVEAGLEEAVQKVKEVGFPTEKINARGQLTIWQRLEYLIDPFLELLESKRTIVQGRRQPEAIFDKGLLT